MKPKFAFFTLMLLLVCTSFLPLHSSCFGDYHKLIHPEPISRTISLKHFIGHAQAGQHSVGLPKVIILEQKLLAMSEEQLKEYLLTVSIPYILGPKNQKFLIDGHHTLYTLDRVLKKLQTAGKPIEEFQVKTNLTADWSNLRKSDFMQRMQDTKNLHPYDENGNYKPYDFPQHISKLEIDFYRGLAWLVRKSGAFEKVHIPFFEFYWVHEMRKLLNFSNQRLTRRKIQMAIKLALSQHGSHTKLPGYIRLKPHELKELQVSKYMQKIQNQLSILEESNFLN